MTIQAHETNLLSPLVSHMPTPRQIRLQAYAGVIHGATGVIYYAFDSWVMRNSAETGIAPDMAYNRGLDWAGKWPTNSSDGLNLASMAAWDAAVATNTELTSLKPSILSKKSTAGYLVSLMAAPGAGVRCPWVRAGPITTPNDPPRNCRSSNISTTPIRTMLKGPVGGLYYLLAVNLDNTPLGARFKLDVAPTAPLGMDGAVGTMFEGGRRIRSSPSSECSGSATQCFVDSFEAFGVHVYTWAAQG